ncbi:RNA polymerase sigma factor [Martelella sp. AMO21009]
MANRSTSALRTRNPATSPARTPITATGRWRARHDRAGTAQRRAEAAPSHSDFETEILAQLPKLRRMAGALAGSAADGDDLLQNTLTVAFERRSQWRGGNLGGWLYAIMRHIDANRRRHDRVLPMMVLDEDCGLADHSTEAIEIDRLGVEAALDALEPDFRTIVILRDIEGYGYEEIAERLGIPLGTVMSRLCRARRRLAAALSGEHRPETGDQ